MRQIEKQTRTNGENKMGVMPVNRLLVTMALPIMISMIIQAMYNIVDSLFVARISEQALTAVSLAYSVQNLLIGVAVGTGVGVNSLLSRYLGEQNREGVNKTAVNGIFIMLVTYLFFLVFGLFFTRTFFKLQTDSEEIIELGVQYLSICLIFSVGVLEQVVLERILQGTGKTIYTMITQGAGAVINIILDPILIFGLLGFPRMGISGAAIATVTGQLAGMGMNVYFNKRVNHEVQFVFRGFRPDMGIIKQIYRVGIPAIVMQSIASVMTFGLNQILISYTATAAAVMGVYFKIQSFIFMPVFGLNNGMIPIIGYNLGAGRPERIRKAIHYSLGYATAIMAAGFVLSQVFAVEIMAMFNASEHMMSIGVTALRVISFGYLSASVSVIYSAVFQALGRGLESLVISFFRQLIVLLPAACILAAMFGLDALWWSFPISETMAALLAWVWWKHIRRQMAGQV